MKTAFAFLFLLVVIGSIHGARLPIGTSWTGWSTEQTVWGNYLDYITGEGLAEKAPMTIAVNPGKSAYYIDASATVGGIQWTLANGTYFTINGQCWYSPANYTTEVAAYQNLVKVGEEGQYDFYVGWVDDWGLCSYGLGVTASVNTIDNTIHNLAFAQFAPLSFIPPINITVSGTYNVVTAAPNYAPIPALPKVCSSLNLNNPANIWCDYLKPGATCNGFGQLQCQPIS